MSLGRNQMSIMLFSNVDPASITMSGAWQSVNHGHGDAALLRLPITNDSFLVLLKCKHWETSTDIICYHYLH